MPSAPLPAALFAMDPVHLPALFPPPLMERLRELARIDPDLVVRDFADPAPAAALAESEVLITGWGCPRIDDAALAAMPRLRMVLHAGGSVRHLVGEAFWQRGRTVSSAVQANALPVAEYTLAVILLAGKGVFTLAERYRLGHARPTAGDVSGLGNLGRRVGVVGASRVGRRVMELLRPFDLALSLHDPYVGDAAAAALGAVPLALDDLLRGSDIITLHAPDTAETYRMLDRARLALIPDGGVLINTARGNLIDHEALTDELASGRISAVLDVTVPEPLPAGSPLYRLPNVFLTPHIAGSIGNELERLGRTVVAELERLAAGLPLAHQVRPADLATSA
ncbi:hydroxyacid dehydrogenase [Nonomuraea sp. NPDC050153]|uniref:hydroxyacid dehydrogenase n=1 Tax=Nonomuraea sp. NPDC050153 TaxID=3364359 RepID=UPI0037935C3B